MNVPELNPDVTPSAEQRRGELLNDPWLSRKVDRARRLREHREYIEEYAEELMLGETGVVFDIGPGPGEFLEWARQLGHTIIGIDAETGDGGMGTAYLEYSRLMTERQQVPVDYRGWRTWTTDVVSRHVVPPVRMSDLAASGVFVNSRGSIEQALAHCLEGTPHHVHQDCKRLNWKQNGKTFDEFCRLFAHFRMLLKPGGRVLIHANGTGSETSQQWYEKSIRQAADSVSFRLIRSEGLVLHKWERL